MNKRRKWARVEQILAAYTKLACAANVCVRDVYAKVGARANNSKKGKEMEEGEGEGKSLG